jgi:NTE family protein
MDKPRIGIALSGGGARGIAHIGVLQALIENGIYPESVSGASAGAIVGALYAAGKSPQEMLQFVKDSSLLKLFKVGLPLNGLAKLTYVRDQLKTYIPGDDFAQLQRRLFVAIANLNTGECEMRHEGVLSEVVMASCSIPLVFKPVEINGNWYVDGGLLNNMPVAPLLPHSDILIGVNVIPHVKTASKNVQNIIGIATRCFELSILSNTNASIQMCQVVIEPRRVQAYNIFQFNQYKKLFDIGYQAALDKIPEIRKLMS